MILYRFGRQIKYLIQRNYLPPFSPDLKERQIAPLQDAQRAVRIIRANAAKWGIKTDRVGVKGLSSGGHVIALDNNPDSTELWTNLCEALLNEMNIIGVPLIKNNCASNYNSAN